ncbi:MAG TPA: glutaredoxin family protein [Candidatus Nanoarchaeia archaeon]|nr:glutaredoxin family protein [Candidatus Nanoarchaeia archaeon]
MAEIKVYATLNDPWCEELKKWLKKKKFSFELLDLDESDNARDELIQKSHQLAIPMIDINGEIIVGFFPEKIEAAILKSES